MVLKEVKCYVFGVKHVNGSERANGKYFKKHKSHMYFNGSIVMKEGKC